MVVSPAIGGLIIGHEVARALGARFLFTERDAAGKMTLAPRLFGRPGRNRRGDRRRRHHRRHHPRSDRTAATRRSAQFSPPDRLSTAAAAAPTSACPRVALATLDVVAYAPEDCPSVQQGVPVEKPGSRAAASGEMRRIRITLSYDGTEYHGWQVQPGLPTIQAAVESVLAQIEGAPVHVAASGRTDAGVHALAQVAAFSLSNPIPADNLRKAMNRLLPRDIRVLARRARRPTDFHPRYEALAKTYEYRILRAKSALPSTAATSYHHPYPLDERPMIELAPLLRRRTRFFRLRRVRRSRRAGPLESPPHFFARVSKHVRIV